MSTGLFKAMLTDRIYLVGPDNEEPEDFFGESLGVIFPDDITNQHGDSTSKVIFKSERFGDITLALADPEGEDSRRLFSHFLWNAGLQLAEFIEAGVDDQGRNWDVHGKKTLELGAGTGLSGIISVLAGAETIISDYPAPEVLLNIDSNIKKNLSDELRMRCRVQGHEWGVLDDEFSSNHKGSFARMLVADCLWMPWQHENLAKSISHFLSPGDGRAWIVAGFHTGREKMRGFYDAKKLDECGLEVEDIWERDCEGKEREWMVDRGIEDVTMRKRWLVIGVLKKKGVSVSE